MDELERLKQKRMNELQERLQEQAQEQEVLAQINELERAVTGYARLERELISYQRTQRELEQEVIGAHASIFASAASSVVRIAACVTVDAL